MKIRLVTEKDFDALHEMIARTCRTSFKLYYPQTKITQTINHLSVATLKERATWTHFYVAVDQGEIVGCGAIGPYWNSLTESALFTIFVIPERQGQGLGKKIMATLENDAYFLRAQRVEVAASILAIPFYKKMGYAHKNGVLTYENGHFKMEKFNKRGNDK